MSPPSDRPRIPSELRAHEPFVRRLVRTMLHDEADVEDAVQDTWLRALRRPPTPGHGLRAWLGRVAANLVRDRARARKRQDHLEAAAARPEGDPSAAEQIEREEQRRIIVDAVLALREPYRDVLLLRFYEDLTPAEIAAQLDVPGGTIRSRLKRGLAMLESSLEDQFEDRGGWRVAVLPFVLAGRSPRALASRLAVAATFVLGIVGLGIWAATGPGEARSLELVDGGRPGRDSQKAVTPSDSTNPDPDPRVGVATPAWEIAGRVEDDRGAAFAVLPITIHLTVGDRREPALLHTMTDQAGRFALSLPIVDASVSLVFAPSGRTRATGRHTLFVARDEPRPASHDLRFTLLDRELHGRVLDTAGTPIADASVTWAGMTKAVTDEEGLFTIRAGRGTEVFAAYADGFARESVAVPQIGPGGRIEQDIRLRQGIRVTGVVTDRDGKPIEGVRVHSRRDARGGVTDADGSYQFQTLDPRFETHQVRATHPDYLTGNSLRLSTGRDKRIEGLGFTLHRAAKITGRVTGPDGRAIERARVFLGDGQMRDEYPNARSAADGTFTLRGIMPDIPMIVVVKRRGFATETATVAANMGEGQDPLHVALRRQRTLRGEVVDEKSAPIGGATVRFEQRGVALTPRIDLGCAQIAGADGSFRVDDLPLQLVTMVVSKPGRLEVRREVRAGDPRMTVRLGRMPCLTGLVVDDRTGEPIDDFRIRFVTPSPAGDNSAPGRLPALSRRWRDPGQEFHDDKGQWDSIDAFRHDASGSVYAVEVSATGYAPCIVDGMRPRVSPRPAIARLQPGITLTGQVRLESSGRPITGAEVRLLSQGGRKLSVAELARDPVARTGRTSADGEFRFPCSPEGRSFLMVFHPRYRAKTIGPIELSRGPGILHRNVQLGGLTNVVGAIRGEGIEFPVPVILKRFRGRGFASKFGKSDAQGNFEFKGLQPGQYEIGPFLSYGARGFQQRFVIEHEKECRIDVDATQGDGTIAGSLESNAVLPARMIVRLQPKDPKDLTRLRRTTPSKDGTFAFAGLRPGTYRLKVDSFDPRTRQRFRGSVDVDVAKTDPTKCVIDIHEGRALSTPGGVIRKR